MLDTEDCNNLCICLCMSTHFVCECPYVSALAGVCMFVFCMSSVLVCISRRVLVCKRCSPSCRLCHHAIWRGNRV